MCCAAYLWNILSVANRFQQKLELYTFSQSIY